ncbi:autophagy-related protein 27 [Sporobolomyces koalae]|uniref:autophagy-related protein 27 n=1 Tax=Sporobolomyces koalae TaxID=500713 RepID=UPI0031828577
MRRPTVILASLSLVWAASFDCRDTLSLNGREFDLSSLSGVQQFEEQTQTPPTITKTQYQVSLCAPLSPPGSDVPAGDACPDGTRICMSTFTSREGLDDRLLSVVPIAGQIRQGSEMRVNAIEIEGVDSNERWLLELTGGQYNSVEQSARIEMKCDPDAKETTPKVKEYHSKLGVLDLEWTTAAACPRSKDSAPPEGRKPDSGEGEDGDDKVQGGMGFFAWLFTLVFLGFAAYFVLGAYNNYTTYGATGWDMVPHRDMWRDLPWVISDLFRTRGGSRAGYSSLG